MSYQVPINSSGSPLPNAAENTIVLDESIESGIQDYPENSMLVGHRFIPATAFDLLHHHENLKIHQSPLKGKIRMNSVYVFDTSKSDALYWKNDGKSWHCCWVRAAPSRAIDTPLVRQRLSRLKHNGQLVDCRRTETWQLNGDYKKPSTWKPAVVLVYYHGTLDVNNATNAMHGNLGKKKATQKIFNPKQSKRQKMQFHADLENMIYDNANETSEQNVREDKEQQANQLGFVSTPKSTLQAVDDLIKTGMKATDIQRTLNLEEIYGDDGFEGPRCKKQIQNRIQNSKSQIPRNDNDLVDVYAFGVDHPEIIRKMELLPGLLVMSRHQELERHFADVQKHMPYMIYSYDTTFNLGERFVSALCVKHPGLFKTPVYPLRLLFHEYTDKQFTHGPFFEYTCRDMKKLNSKKTVIISDREASIKSAVAEMLPHANHVFCYLHLFKNIDRWLVKNKYQKEIRRRLHFDIKNLLWSESHESFDDLLQKFLPFVEPELIPLDGVDEAGNITEGHTGEVEYQELVEYTEQFPDEKPNPRSWDTKFQKYDTTYLDKDIRKSFRHSGITSNASESVNSFLQNWLMKTKKPTLYSLVNDVYDHQTSELLEIRKGLWESKGNNLLDPKFQKKRDKLNEIEVQNARIVRKFDSRQITNTNVMSRADDDVNYDSKYKDAMKIIEHKWLDFVRNGYWLVTDKTDKAWKVHFPTQTCDCTLKTRCVHVLAVNLALAAEGNPNFDNLQFAKEPTLTEAYKRQANKKVGKKGRGNRVPVQYEAPKENENMKDGNEIQISAVTVSRKIPNQKSATAAIQALPRIPWGGRIKFGADDKPLSLTCSLDNIIQVLYSLYKTSNASEQYVDAFATVGIRRASALLKMFRSMDNCDFDKAKRVWITKLMRLKNTDFPGRTATLPITTEDANLSNIKFLNPVVETRMCHNPDCSRSGTTVIYPMSDWTVRSPIMYSAQFNTVIVDERCDAGECTTESPERSYSFQNGAPPFLVYGLTSGGPRGTETHPSEVPETQNILGNDYNLFAFTVHQGNTQLSEHFYTIFKLDNKFYKYVKLYIYVCLYNSYYDKLIKYMKDLILKF